MSPTPPTTKKGLAAHGLELWRGDNCLFSDLGFDLAPGRAVFVSGANGVGKTSLLRVVSGLTQPESGTIMWNGVDCQRVPQPMREALSFLGHRNGLCADLTAIENLVWGARLKRVVDTNAAQACLDEMGLSAITTQYARGLSAGQKRRVALARVLLSATPLWILDEPFANLDSAGREWCSERMRDHVAGGGLLMVSSHQDPGLAAGTFDELELTRS